MVGLFVGGGYWLFCVLGCKGCSGYWLVAIATRLCFVLV